MSAVPDRPIASITAFRSALRSLIDREARCRRRDVVVFAIDGIPHGIAAPIWSRGTVDKMESVFPTTSSVGWLSSLTGLGVEAHGVPGVVFKHPDGGSGLIEVFSYPGRFPGLAEENVFSDALSLGYEPVAVMGDLRDLECGWRDSLLRHSRVVPGNRLYAAGRSPGPEEVCELLREAIFPLLAPSSRPPRLIWTFVDLDQHIHRHGYDLHVADFLECIQGLAVELTDRGVVVLAHSDHGLVPTVDDVSTGEFFEQLESVWECRIGGAGRARWLYPPAGRATAVYEEIIRSAPPSLRTFWRSDLFDPTAPSCDLIGEIVILAEGERFVTSPTYIYDHGSLTEDELIVPLARWGEDVELDL